MRTLVSREELLQKGLQRSRDKRSVSIASEGNFMKTIFNSNNRGKSILYILFALAVLSFAALLLFPILLHGDISPLALIPLMGIVFLGGLLIQMRSGPPW